MIRPPKPALLFLVTLLACAGLAACTPSAEDHPETSPVAGAAETVSASTTSQANFDGADWSGPDEMMAHGARIAELMACNSCHLADYTGANFGEMIPLIEGLWATNISLTLPDFSDEELERLLREGVHPEREIYLMPSKQSQFLGARDMDALIAFLRTVEPAGEPTPPPPPGFEDAVTARLPDDYWLTMLEGHPRNYHNAQEEAEYFAANATPDFGPESAKGRMVTLTICTSCHGAAMDGLGEPAGNIQGALEYDDTEFVTLLRDGVDRSGQKIEPDWAEDHVHPLLTDGEIEAAIRYVRRLARHRAGG